LLIGDAELRRRLGEAGARSVRQKFSSEPGIDFVARMLGESRRRAAA
jgi:hypothetical protein